MKPESPMTFSDGYCLLLIGLKMSNAIDWSWWGVLGAVALFTIFTNLTRSLLALCEP